MSRSISAARIPISARTNVITKQSAGSPRKVGENTLRNGMTSSLDIACNNLGADIKLCKAAPEVEKNEPIKMNHS